MKSSSQEFHPSYIIAPGQILEETLESRGIKKIDFAERCGRTAKMISEIIAGKAPITPETAIQFERVLDIPARVWSNLETNYRLRLAEQEEIEKFQKHNKVSNLYPIKELAKFGFIENVTEPAAFLGKLLKFFGVGSVDALDACLATQTSHYRGSQSFKSNRYSVAAWLRCGEICAEEIKTKPYNEDKFKDSLKRIRSLTRVDIEVALDKAAALCAEAGVALVFVPEIGETRLSGAARWVTKDKAVIQLSIRHKSDDHLWFTFFHEACHILHHGKKDLFVDDDDKVNDAQEKEADLFAQNFLISSEDWKDFIFKWADFPSHVICEFAEEKGIAPGIIVGRLQFQDGLLSPKAKQNALKVGLDWDIANKRVIKKTKSN